jgi:hypothetical protein
VRLPRSLTRLIRKSLFFAAGLSCACAAAQFDGTVYRGNGVAFRLGPQPEAWQRLDTSDVLLAFRDDRAAATIAVNGRCGLDGDDVPLRSLTQHLFIHFTEREPVSERELLLDGRGALRTELSAKLDGVSKRFTVFVVKKDGCVYDFMHIADTATPPESQAEFERFVTGFQTLR